MSAFWSGWIKALVVFNMGITFFLFIFAIRVKIPVDKDGTTGHVWAHGTIREGLAKLPVWWILTSAAMFFSAWTYMYLYPGFGSNAGTLGWTQHQEVARDLAANRVKLDATYGMFRDMPLEKMAMDDDARRLGHRLFIDNCSACHGRNGQGNPGYPNLSDTHWTWGGTPDDILTTIRNGRTGIMTPMAAALGGDDGVREVAHYVASLSGIKHDASLVDAGKERFGMVCAACHSADASGNTMLGAPDLRRGIFLHGGTVEDIIETVEHGRTGEMPAWSGRLDDDEIRLIASWVIGNVDHNEEGAGSSQ